MAYGNGGMVGSATPSAPRPMGMITDQMNTLDGRTNELHQVISELDARLSILLSALPPKVDQSLAPPANSVQLGSTLAQMNDRIAQACQQLRGIIDRVEL